jgi:peroxiredoxin Q/BCP
MKTTLAIGLATFLPLTGCADRSATEAKPAIATEPTAAAPASAAPAPASEPAARPTLLAVGDPVPAITAVAHDGTTVELGKPGPGPTVVYFYPKDETPGCTVEAEAFRDQLPDAAKLGARVVGISVDSIESHKAFAENRKLNFPLLSDPDGAIAARFGVSVEGGHAERVTFVIGPDGRVARVFPGVKVDGHAAEVLATLQSLGQRTP